MVWAEPWALGPFERLIQQVCPVILGSAHSDPPLLKSEPEESGDVVQQKLRDRIGLLSRQEETEKKVSNSGRLIP